MADLGTPPRLQVPGKVLRVGEITRYLKRMVEDDQLLSDVSVVGEVTNLSRAASGHCYFTLKDELGQLSCVMWRQEVLQQRDELAGLRQGVNVVVEGLVTVYERQGKYQLTVARLRVQGAGAARVRFERLRKKLQAEGLFAEERKRPLPEHPKTLALITSPGSNAYHDVIRRLESQWPRIKVIVGGVSVQGEQAPAEIELALDIVNRMTDADVILLVRGGGSPEELAWFNEERIARAIFASRIPVVTGIGHDQDVTIADLVADHRATTPTWAAAAAVPDGIALRKTCQQLNGQMTAHMRQAIRSRRGRLAEMEKALLRCSPVHRLRTRRQRIDELWPQLVTSTTRDLEVRRRRLDALGRQIQALDPFGVLRRGYALLTEAETGQVVASVAQASPGKEIRARVKDGSFRATIGGRDE